LLTSEELDRTIAIDMDGVLLEYDAWRGMNHLGKPINHAVSSLQRLRDAGWRIVIYTARLNPESYREDLVSEYFRWIDEYLHACGFVYDSLTGMKPCAILYVDDRALRFISWFDTFEQINRLERERAQTKGDDNERHISDPSDDPSACTARSASDSSDDADKDK